jgi:hypothetical protein
MISKLAEIVWPVLPMRRARTRSCTTTDGFPPDQGGTGRCDHVESRYLRYTIRPGLFEDWAGKWRDLVVPLRLERGFDTGNAWHDHERSQFLWVIFYKGEDTFEEADERY